MDSEVERLKLVLEIEKQKTLQAEANARAEEQKTLRAPEEMRLAEANARAQEQKTENQPGGALGDVLNRSLVSREYSLIPALC